MDARAYVRDLSVAVRARLPLLYGRNAPSYAVALSQCCSVRSILDRSVAIAKRLGVEDPLPIVVATEVDDVADFWERVFMELRQVSGPGALPYQSAIAEDIAQDLGAVIAYSARRRESLQKNWCKYPETHAPFPLYEGKRKEASEAWKRPLSNPAASSYASVARRAVESLRAARPRV